MRFDRHYILYGFLLTLILGLNTVVRAQYVVTSTNDPVNPFNTVSGELRYAMEQAVNSHTPVTITFNITTGTPPYVIDLKSQLPPINNPNNVSIKIDGTSQSGYSPGNPVIIIDGYNNNSLIPTGLYVFFNNVTIKGLYFRNFNIQGLTFDFGNGCELSDCIVNRIYNNSIPTVDVWLGGYETNLTLKSNIIGTDGALTNFGTPSNVGCDVGGSTHNCFIGTGSSGDANIIADHTGFGIFFGNIGYDYSYSILFSQNEIFNNPTAIYLGLARLHNNNSKPAPNINPITFLNNVTGTSQPYDKVELFGGTGPQNANEYLKTVTADGAGNWSADLSANTYSYVTATATDNNNNTSPLSSAIVPPQNLPCQDCIGSFAPDGGKSYVISAWVKEDNAPVDRVSYTHPKIYIDFYNSGNTLISTAGPFIAKGEIIDGWQRIEETYLEPAATADLKIRLVSDTGDCNFDDIRVFPFDGEMKTFVYDPTTLRLVSELDEQNYSTLYEYDEEGKLVRVKKETERGVMTIKEVRTHVQKQ